MGRDKVGETEENESGGIPVKTPDRKPDYIQDQWSFWFEEMIEQWNWYEPEIFFIKDDEIYVKHEFDKQYKIIRSDYGIPLLNTYKDWLFRKEFKKLLEDSVPSSGEIK